MRKSRAWSIEEHAQMLRMRGEGATNLQISRALKRSYHAIKVRITARDVYRPLRNGRPPLNYERVTVDKSEVVALYEQGWRFAGFDGARCIFQRLA